MHSKIEPHLSYPVRLLVVMVVAMCLWAFHFANARAANDYVTLGAGNCYGEGWASYSTDYGRAWTYDFSGNPCQRYLSGWFYNEVLDTWYQTDSPGWFGYNVTTTVYQGGGGINYSHRTLGTHNMCTVLMQSCNGYEGTDASR
jgi:hypothetical protein